MFRDSMSEGLSWEQRAVTAEASLQSLRDKVVPLVSKTKELEKEAKVSVAMACRTDNPPGLGKKNGNKRKKKSCSHHTAVVQKWKELYEMQSSSPVQAAGSGTLRNAKNPSQVKQKEEVC